MSHIKDKIDFTAEVFIVYKNKVLLRKHDKLKIWLSVGGHIELDEDPNQAAIREVKEEVGLDIELTGTKMKFNDTDYEELIPPKYLNRHRISDEHGHVTLVYFAKSDTDKVSQMNTEDSEISEEIRWFAREDLDDPKYNLRENIIFYAQKALEELGA